MSSGVNKHSKSTVVIIGGGISGLSAGAFLARQGFKVTLLERLNELSGYVHTFKRGKYVFEASTHQISGCGMTKYGKDIIHKLDLDSNCFVKSPILLNKVEKLTGIPIRKTAAIIESATRRTMYKYSWATDGAMVGAAYSSSQIYCN